MAAQVITRISARVLRSLLQRFYRNSRRLEVNILTRILSTSVSNIIVRRVNDNSALNECLTANSTRNLRLLTTVTSSTGLRLNVLEALRTIRHFLVNSGLTCRELTVCNCGLVAYRRSDLFN